MNHALELAREVERIGRVTGDRDLEILASTIRAGSSWPPERQTRFNLMEEAMVSVVTG